MHPRTWTRTAATLAATLATAVTAAAAALTLTAGPTAGAQDIPGDLPGEAVSAAVDVTGETCNIALVSTAVSLSPVAHSCSAVADEVEQVGKDVTRGLD